ncbi:MAG: phenylalanine--tRNA ligase subunit beta, partial [Flavisolibacter sp.]
EKERKLHADDLMICNIREPMCIAGVFGGLYSGVTQKTTSIFLESAWFDPVSIRKTSFRHGLRTDAATRFEKGTDISQTVLVLKRAASMIKKITGGMIASEVVDEYVNEQPKTTVSLTFNYLKKLSGKKYDENEVQKILGSLGFNVKSSSKDSIDLEVPYHKPDVSLPADVVEEILRIDGLDNIDIPTSVRMSPSLEENYKGELTREKISQVLTGLSFSEILTNSITNSALVPERQQQTAVKMLNSLSSELNILRPTMVPTALDVISFNLNRKNNDLKFYEFGKTYSSDKAGIYQEKEHLCLYVTGQATPTGWKGKGIPSDIFYIKGLVETLLVQLGIKHPVFQESDSDEFFPCLALSYKRNNIGQIGKVKPDITSRFDIRQHVFIADLYWEELITLSSGPVKFREIAKFQSVERDLAVIVPDGLKYEKITSAISGLRLEKLREVKLFDIFESEKLGAGKKSLAINLSFLDEEKTLTDKEIDAWMNRIMVILEKELGAEIRK